MKRFFIHLSYKGTNYHGWQSQPNAITIQEKIQDGLRIILKQKINIVGAGRTDTGVHANYFIAHFDANEFSYKLADLTYKLNSYLPKDIAIFWIKEVPSNAHARFDALSRTYHYYIHNQKDPFLWDSSWYYKGNLTIEQMDKACNILKKHTDFTSFSKLHTDAKTNNCNIISAKWDLKDHKITFEITADRFLRNMVRAIVGTMVNIGKGCISLKEFEDIILAKNRGLAGASAPAQGLFLSHIKYPENIYKEYI